MKILFFIHRLSRLRHFDSVVTMLADRGHVVRLVPTNIGKKASRRGYAASSDRVTFVKGPIPRRDEWGSLAPRLRRTRDRLRFYDGRFSKADAVTRRSQGMATGRLFDLMERHAGLRRHWRLFETALATIEDAIPSDARIERFIERERPDVILVTPLVSLATYQTDFVKSAHALALPVAFLPFSWDNLTTRGLIRVIPDRVLVWNETQKWEAVAFHRVPPDRVVITGAPRFDSFFASQPSTSREDFCVEAGLDPSHPFVLYLGSSELVAADESDFVRRWVHKVRTSADPRLRSSGILIRPHPTRQQAWADLDLDAVGSRIWQTTIEKAGGQSLFDSLHHATVVVGLNTSALIEAGIAGKAIHTLALSEPGAPRDGTFHGQYLRHAHGGLVVPATTWEEHGKQLAEALARPASRRDQALRFVEGFVRPHGIDLPATPIMVKEIERLADIRKRSNHRAKLWHYPVRWSALGLSRLSGPQPYIDDRNIG